MDIAANAWPFLHFVCQFSSLVSGEREGCIPNFHIHYIGMIHRDILHPSHHGTIPYPRAHYTRALHSIVTRNRRYPRSTFSQRLYPCLRSIMLAYSPINKHPQNSRNSGKVDNSLTILRTSTGPLSIRSIAGILIPSSKDAIEVRHCTGASDQGRRKQTGERNALHVASFPSFLWNNEKIVRSTGREKE